jgi:hypothetical protein
VLAGLATSRADHLIGAGQSTPAALTGGYHLAFLAGAGLVIAGLVVAIRVLEKEPASPRQAPAFAQPADCPSC